MSRTPLPPKRDSKKPPPVPRGKSSTAAAASGSDPVVAPYTIFYNPKDPSEATVTIHSYPLPKEANKAMPFKLADQVDVKDPENTPPGPISFKNGMLIVDKTTILKDEIHGEYAEIVVRLNSSSLEELIARIQQQGEQPVPVGVTLFLDMTGLTGAMAGIALPGGTVTVPVKGFTRVQVRFAVSFNLSFQKSHWATVEKKPLHEFEGVDKEALTDVALKGGTLRMRLVGTAKVNEETEIGCPKLEYAKLNLTSEDGRFAISNMNEGAATANKPKGSEITYDTSTSEYVFEIPGPDGKPGPVDVQIDVPIYPEEVIANRFRKIYGQVLKTDAALESNLEEKASVYIADLLQHMGEKTEEELNEGSKRFLHATAGTAYFQEFTYLCAKGLRNALHLHLKCYDRFMENLFNGVVEWVFMMGEGLTEKITARLLKGEKEVLERELKANAKTLAEAAAESTESIVKQKKGEAKAVLEELEAHAKNLRKEAAESAARTQTQITAAQQTRRELAERTARGEVLESEIRSLDEELEQLAKEAEGFRKQLTDIDTKITDLKTLRREVTKEIDTAGEELRRLGSKLSDNAREVENLKSGVRKLESEVDQTRKLLSEQTSGVQTAQRQFDSAEKKLGRLKSDKHGVESSLKALDQEEATLRAAVARGDATADQLRRLDEIPSHKKIANRRINDVDYDLSLQHGNVDRAAADLRNAEKSANVTGSKLSQLEEQARQMGQQLENTKTARVGIEDEIGKQERHLDFSKKKEGDLTDEEGVLRNRADDSRVRLENNTNDANAKDMAANEKARELGVVEEKRQNLIQENASQMDNLGKELDKLSSNLDKHDQLRAPILDASTDLTKLDAQIDALATLRQRPRGMSQEEYVQFLRQKLNSLPSDGSVGEKICKKLGDEMGLDDYKEIITKIERNVPSGLPDELRKQIGTDLDRMRGILRKAVHTTEKDQALKRVVVQETMDRIKGKINDQSTQIAEARKSKRFVGIWEDSFGELACSIAENVNRRAEEIRQAIVDVTHSDYKAINSEHYDDTMFGWACSSIDSRLEKLAGYWNRMCESVSGYYTEWKKEYPEAMAFAEQIVLYILSIMVELFNRVLQLVQLLLDKIVEMASHSSFAASRLVSKARELGQDDSSCPSQLNSEFYKFSQEMVSDAAQAANLRTVVSLSGSKASVASELRRPFAGPWKRFYEPQWLSARSHFVAMAGSVLTTSFLESEKVNATRGRSCTMLLQSIVSPLTDYANSFDATSEGGLVSAMTVYYTGRWTPQDADVIIEGVGWTGSMGMKVAGLALAFTPYAPFVAPMMIAADSVDRWTAVLRVVMSAFFTNPFVLGGQFDIMRVYNLGYKAIFQEADVEGFIIVEPEPAFGLVD